MCGGLIAAATPAYAADLFPVPKPDYLLAAVSSEKGAYPAPPALDGTALGAFDGSYTTQWVTNYPSATYPHWINIDLQRPISVKALDYSGRLGQGVNPTQVQVFATNSKAVAGSAPTDGSAWGEPVAVATLTAPTSNTQKQRIELPAAVDAQYIAFRITASVNGKDGGAGEIEILSDEAIPPIPEEPTPTTPETFTISRGELSADVAQTFPQIVGYSVQGEELAGNLATSEGWAVNGVPYAATTTATQSATSVQYVSELEGIDVQVTSVIEITESGNVEFRVTDIAGSVEVNTLGLPGNVFLSTDSTDAESVLDRTIVSPDSTTNADEHIAVTGETSTGSKGAAYAFVGNGALTASIITNATVQGTSGNSSWNNRLTTSVTGTSTRTASVGSNTWLVHPANASDSRVTTYEMPKVTVLFAQDRNSDGAVDWQDAGIRYREVDEVRLGAERVAERVVSRIPFNFASQATNYFDLTLENTQRIANQTDGLGQYVLNKGFGSEGHDSANTDYGGNYNERAGDLADLNNLVDVGATLNADMSVHVNATEIYPQANSFDEAILDGSAPWSPGWSWLDQSYYINQQKDLGTGMVLDRFQQLRDEVPGLSGVYIDVYYSNGWVAEGLANELHDMDLEIATEWGDKFVDNAVWAHWPIHPEWSGRRLERRCTPRPAAPHRR